jgi:hypothetical protein
MNKLEKDMIMYSYNSHTQTTIKELTVVDFDKTVVILKDKNGTLQQSSIDALRPDSEYRESLYFSVEELVEREIKELKEYVELYKHSLEEYEYKIKGLKNTIVDCNKEIEYLTSLKETKNEY